MSEIKERRALVTVDAELKELIPRYLENRAGDVNAILDALGKSDFETIRILGHGMKGSGGGYGFDRITDIGRTVETAAKEGDAGEIRRQVEELRLYLEQVEIAYE